MDSELPNSGRRVIVAYFLLAGIAAYIALVSAQFLAAQLSTTLSASRLRWAIQLDPLNAEYHDLIGILYLRGRSNPLVAQKFLERATALNPNRSSYWLDRATAEELRGDFPAEDHSLARAVETEPHSAGVAWEAANLYLAQGAGSQALREYRRVMETDVNRAPRAISICWRMRHDIGFLLENVVPANADIPFLEFLISENQQQAAAQVWEKIISRQQPVEHRYLFEYLRYLFAHHDFAQAAQVWQQAAIVSGLAPYQPSDENLLVNADFALPVLNGGFDWNYQKTPGVSLALDPVEEHTGARSLRVAFEGTGIADAGVHQIVSVLPDRQYIFSGFYKAEEMDGAGGVRITIQDPETGDALFRSDDLRNSEFWRQVQGVFSTRSGTHAVVLCITRVPSGSPIRGKLWLDDLKLVAADSSAAISSPRVPGREQP